MKWELGQFSPGSKRTGQSAGSPLTSDIRRGNARKAGISLHRSSATALQASDSGPSAFDLW